MKENLSLPYQVYINNGKTLQGMCLNKQYEVKEELGCGKYGRVFKALDLKRDILVAIKLLDIKKMEE